LVSRLATTGGEVLEHQVRHALGVVLPDGKHRRYRFDFSSRRPAFTVDERAGETADIVHHIAASALAG